MRHFSAHMFHLDSHNATATSQGRGLVVRMFLLGTHNANATFTIPKVTYVVGALLPCVCSSEGGDSASTATNVELETEDGSR